MTKADAYFGSIGKILFPILFTVLCSIIAFLYIQDMEQKEEIGDVKLEELGRYAEVCQKIALLQLTVNGIKVQIDKLVMEQEARR